jgi:hypothetical protein
MSNRHDHPMYRTFEEFEREELRRAEAIGGSVESLFDEMFTEDIDFDATSARLASRDDADDEEE